MVCVANGLALMAWLNPGYIKIFPKNEIWNKFWNTQHVFFPLEYPRTSFGSLYGRTCCVIKGSKIPYSRQNRENTKMTLPHLGYIFTSKQLTETTLKQLPPTDQPVTVHRIDSFPSSPVTIDDGQPVILLPGPCREWIVKTWYSASGSSKEIWQKLITGYFPLWWIEKYGKAPVPCKALLFCMFRKRM